MAPPRGHVSPDKAGGLPPKGPGYKKGLRWRAGLVLMYTASVMLYIAFGGAVLVALEAGPERDRLRMTASAVNLTNVTLAQREALAELGVCDFRDPEVPDNGYYWTYEGAFLFALTVVTTIGYGDRTSPVTHGGRAFTCVYAVFGIAIVLSDLMRIAALLMDLVQGIVHRSHKKLHDLDARHQRRLTRHLVAIADNHLPFLSTSPVAQASRQRRDQEQLEGSLVRSGALDKATGEVRCDVHQLREVLGALGGEEVTARVTEHVFKCACTSEDGLLDEAGTLRAVAMWRDLQRNSDSASIGAFLVALSCCFGWVLIWYPTFSNVEGWGFFETCWFSFITLTTIGLGDYAPTHRRTRWALWVFIIPGLGLTGWCLQAFNGIYVRYMRDRALRRMHERGLISLRALEAAGAATDLEVRIQDHAKRTGNNSSPDNSPTAAAGRRRNVSFVDLRSPTSAPSGPESFEDALAQNAAELEKAEAEVARLRAARERLHGRRTDLLSVRSPSGTDRLSVGDESSWGLDASHKGLMVPCGPQRTGSVGTTDSVKLSAPPPASGSVFVIASAGSRARSTPRSPDLDLRPPVDTGGPTTPVAALSLSAANSKLGSRREWRRTYDGGGAAPAGVGPRSPTAGASADGLRPLVARPALPTVPAGRARGRRTTGSQPPTERLASASSGSPLSQPAPGVTTTSFLSLPEDPTAAVKVVHSI
eukprot:TRINITY_DN22326_c0_g1_i1.p1 TRINITY_DN22326_c0_g1~~TRINITY_DN22326_c0_g1_i1.p1  ORF type:complete len:732 (+),score=164.92 TRINITY_DN22326_c0_g1_i1:84-2198(+)